MNPIPMPFTIQELASEPEARVSALEEQIQAAGPRTDLFTWFVEGGQWLAEFISGSMSCFIIEGPGVDGQRVFGSRSGALAELAAALRVLNLRRAKALAGLRIERSEQTDVGAGCHYLQAFGLSQPTFLAVGPRGPFGNVLDNANDAHSAAYELARRITAGLDPD